MTKPHPNKPDKVIANTGWGVKPDDQPANASEATHNDAGGYHYRPDEPDVVRKILQQQRKGFNTANQVVVQPGTTTIIDINSDRFVIQNLSFGSEHLCELLKALGASFSPKQLDELPPDFDGVREYSLTRTWAWGAQRTG